MIDLSRSEILIGAENMLKLKQSTVAVFGLGGVGGYAAEAIARAGVGTMIIADYDSVTPSNINRQILSLTSTMGHLKTEVSLKRLKDINPEIEVITISDRLSTSLRLRLFLYVRVPPMENDAPFFIRISVSSKLPEYAWIIPPLRGNPIRFIDSISSLNAPRQ